MTIGSQSARPEKKRAGISRKLLSLLMACVLATSLVPSAAWADEADAAGGAGEGAVVPAEDELASQNQQVGESANVAEPSDERGSAGQGEASCAGNAAGARTEAGLAGANASEASLGVLSASSLADASAPYAAGGPCTDEDWDALGRVEIAGTAEVGATLEATAYCEYDEVMTETITYQWQVGASRYGAYTDIPGATARAFTVPSDCAGKYLMVKATGGSYNDTVKATVGPVSSPDTTILCRVDVFRGDDQMNSPYGGADELVYAGDALEARPFKDGSSSGTNGTDVSDDPNVTYQWTLLDSRNADEGTNVGGTRELNLDESMVGKYLKVTANGGAGETSRIVGPVALEGALRLASVSIALSEGKSAVLTGDTVEAKPVLAGGAAVPEEADVSYQWWARGVQDSDFAKIDGAVGKTLLVPDDLAGATLKVTASVKGYNEVAATKGPVVSAHSAQAAVAALDGARYMPSPSYGTDANMARMVEAELAQLGFVDASVKVSACAATRGGAGVSSADDGTNGDISYYYEDPETTDSPKGYADPRVTFEITVDGASASWSKYPTIRWDMGKVAEKLQGALDEKVKASDLLSYEGGEADDAAGTVDARKDLSLPTRLVDWADLSWSSSDAGVVADDGTITRADADACADITATATFSLAAEDEAAATASKTFKVTVKPASTDPTDEERVQAALDKIVLKDSATKEPIDLGNVAADVQLPTKGSLGIGGAAYSLTCEVSPTGDQAVSITGARLNVARPAPGLPDAHDTLVITITRNDVELSRSFDLTVKALDTSEIDAEIALMEQAKASYFDGIKGANASADQVTGNLASFQQVRSDGAGGLAWAHTSTEVAGQGIVPVAIDPSHPSEQWNLFKSSRPSLITHENLLLASTPVYNTAVTIESCLSSEKFGAYYERYKNDPAIDPAVLAKYKALYRQPVSITVVVRGSTGQDDPNPPAAFSTSVQVYGKDGAAFMPKMEYRAQAEDTAWDATVATLKANGYLCTGAGILSSVTNPAGETLGTSSYNWVLYVNGAYSNVYAFNYQLKKGDEVAWVYTDDGFAALPDPDIAVDPNAPRPDWSADWPGFGDSGNGSPTVDVAAPTRKAEESWVYGYTEDEINGRKVTSRYVSEPVLAGGSVFLAYSLAYWDNATYSNVVLKSALVRLDAATGAVLASTNLPLPIDNTGCRPVYADGLIVVPLTSGRLLGVAADSLQFVWLTDGLKASDGSVQKSFSTLSVHDGYVYTGTSSGYGEAEGVFQCVNLKTGAVAWRVANDKGFYWDGAAFAGSCVAYAGDDGNLVLRDAVTGAEKDSLSLGHKVRSSIAAEGGMLYVADYDGVLHKVEVTEDALGASLREVASVKFAAQSVSSPVVSGGNVFVGGCTDGFASGSLSVIDAEKMQVKHTITTLEDGSPIPARVDSTPLVSVQGPETYVYFVNNHASDPSDDYSSYGSGGGVFVYRLGDKAASLLHEPSTGLANYSAGSVIAGPDGTLYYTNDSGHLFALRAKTDGGPDGGPNGGNGSGGGDNGGAGNKGGVDSLNGAGGAGSVPAAYKPLSQSEAKAGDAQDDSAQGEAARTSAATVADAGAGAAHAASESAEDGSASVGFAGRANPWAVGGIAVGIVGLAGTAAYVMRVRRRGGEAS